MGHDAISPAPAVAKQRPNRLCRPERQCGRPTPRGPCRAPRRPGSESCYWHDAQLGEYRKLAAARGGSAPRRIADLGRLDRLDLASPDGLLAFERTLLREVASGRLSAGRASMLLRLADRVHAQSKRDDGGSAMREAIRELMNTPPPAPDED